MRPRTALRAATAALLASVLLAACGTAGDHATPISEAEKPTPLEAITLVSAKTNEAKTARLAFTVTTSLPGGQTQTVSGEGAADFAAQKVRMTIGAGGQKIDMVVVGTTIYMRLPAGQRPQPGKPWLKLDVAALGKASGSGLGGLSQGAGSDPTQALALLKGVSSDIREVGAEQVRDADTTHYRATIDLQKAAEQQGAAKKQVARFLEQAEVRSVPADVWVDGEGRLRKMRYDMKLKPSGAQGTITVRSTVEMFDFGTTVTVAGPPASQVADFAGLLPGGATG